jgi:hypothetical protein
MKEQKVIITSDTRVINDWLISGWKVVSVTAQHVSAAPSTAYTATQLTLKGDFCFVLERVTN